ncbi:hypothetical protein JCM10207_001961 [Rhodosporidiobolus poonsookiae]
MAKLEDVSSSPVPSPVQAATEQLVAAAQSVDSAPDAAGWSSVAQAGKTIADGLRSEQLRTALAQTGVLKAVGRLLGAAVRAADQGGEEMLRAKTELARVVGNMCFEHDANRQQCLDAAVPLSLGAVLSALLGVTEEGEKVEQQRVLRVEELKLLRAAVGALLNMSLKFDPVRRELTKREILRPLLALLDTRTSACKSTAPIYTVGCWAQSSVGDADEWEERLQIGSTVLSWVVNILEDVLAENKSDFPSSGVLSLSSALLSIYTNSSHPARTSHFSGEDASDFLDTDIEILTVSAALLEGVAIDLDAAKEALAFSTFNSSLSYPDSTLLEHLLAFIKSASPPPYWSHATDDQARTAKAFSTIKAAVVRAVVEAPNSDEVMERLWTETRVPSEGTEADGERKSWLVDKLVLWLEEAQGQGREDMLICAAHMLAGLGRSDAHTEALVHEYGLAAPLARIVREHVDRQLAAPGERGRPGETTQILFGVVSLLRHLAIPLRNRQVVGETGVVPTVALLLRKELDIVGPLQLSAIGLLKHLTATNIANSLEVLGLPPPADDPDAPAPSSTLPLEHIAALVSRTDDTRLRSEATRILVNLVRTLFSSKPAIAHAPSHDSAQSAPAATHLDDEEVLRAQGREVLVRMDVVEALSELVRLSERYPMLINEGIVALALLAGGSDQGATLVLAALVSSHLPASPAPAEPTDLAAPSTVPQPKRSTSLAVSAAGDPPCAADMLSTWLGLVASDSLTASSSPAAAAPTTVRPEMVANAAALLVAVLQRAGVAGQPGADELKAKVLGPLQGAKERLDANGEQQGALAALVRKALEVVQQQQQQ